MCSAVRSHYPSILPTVCCLAVCVRDCCCVSVSLCLHVCVGVQAPDGPVPDHPWREAMDPATMQLYYYNIKTMETQWTRPVEMGPAPSATGW
jgi:hypothetical protein